MSQTQGKLRWLIYEVGTWVYDTVTQWFAERAEQAYEDTENDTPLGEYKEQGKTIFMNAFKEAYEATGNEYY